MMRPRIDVLIPAFNAAATIEGSIESIRRQTIKELRIVVVDDESTDGTAVILSRLAGMDPRIVVINRPHGGIVDALNAGLRECTAEFVARHDADDIAYPHRFAVQLEYLDAHPDCVAVSSYARQVDKDGRPSGFICLPPPLQSDPTWVPCREPYLLHPFLMVRRSAMTAIAGYRHVHHAEDADLCWRLQEFGQVDIVPQALGDYRVHSQSVTGSSPLNGRLSALNSQLAAISAVRRRHDRADLIFTKAAMQQQYAAVTTSCIFEIGARELDDAERRYLKGAYAAKFLELATHKPYLIDVDDCRFIGSTLLPLESALVTPNRRELRKLRAKLSARLLLRGKVRSAAAIFSRETLIDTLGQICIQACVLVLPAQARSTIWAWRCRYKAAKLQKGSVAA